MSSGSKIVVDAELASFEDGKQVAGRYFCFSTQRFE